jgi:hypothetical protein
MKKYWNIEEIAAAFILGFSMGVGFMIFMMWGIKEFLN